jgi:hypothetical protein
LGIQFDPDSIASPESLWDHWMAISNVNGMRTSPQASAETQAILECIAARGQARGDPR